mmetsp:Transcript_77225/g.234108  ORF Transcript_77225/g.234108 Transcript_77225/m.234108 type:complete len:217 (+) Transcript_77225:144-794(+)
MPGGLDKLAGSKASTHHPGWLPCAGQSEFVQANSGRHTSGLDAHGPEGALELAGGKASAQRRAEVPGRLHKLTSSKTCTHHPGRLPCARQGELIQADASRYTRWLHAHGSEGALELARGKTSAEGRAEVPRRLHELSGSQASAHHPGRLPCTRQSKLVQADASGDTRRLDAHGAEGALELACGEAGAQRGAEVPGGLDKLARGEAGAHHPGGLPGA